jgi:hypothetical protein
MYIDILELGVVTRTVQVLRTTSGTSTRTVRVPVLVRYELYSVYTDILYCNCTLLVWYE